MKKIHYFFALCTCMLMSIYAKADGVEIPIVNTADVENEFIPLITSASQLDAGDYGDYVEGLHPEYLLDGDAETYWHSDYRESTRDSHADPDHHWLIAEFDKHLVGEFVLGVTRRKCPNDHVTKMLVEGSNNGTDWTSITELTLSNATSGSNAQSEFFKITGEGYTHLRFAATATSSEFKKFWHAAEMQLYAVKEKVGIPVGATAKSIQLSFSYTNPDNALMPMWLASSPDGEAYYIKAENQPEQYAAWNVEPILGETWEMGSEGTKVTCQVFYLRNATTGQYLKMADEGGFLWNTKTWERKMCSTTDKNTALKLVLVPASAYTDHAYTPSTYLLQTYTDMRQDTGIPLDGYWGIAAYLEESGDWYTPWIAARKYIDQGFEYSGDMSAHVTQHTHDLITDLNKLYAQLSAVNVATDFPTGTALGQYEASAVNAFTTMLANSSLDATMNDMDGDHTDATVNSWIDKLHTAYNAMTKAKIQPKFNGYYRLVSTADDNEWTIYDQEGKDRSFCCEKPDASKMSQIWGLKYDEVTGKTLWYNLETNSRLCTDFPYIHGWGNFQGASEDGMIRIDYAGEVGGEVAFYLRLNKQPYGYGDCLHMNTWEASYYISTHGDDSWMPKTWYIREVTDIEVLESLTLVDQQPYTSDVPVVAKNFHYTRNLNNTGFQALYLPVAMPVEAFTDQDVDVYFLNDNRTYFDEAGNMVRTTMEVVPITSGTLIANTPYLIKAKATGAKDFTATSITVLPAQSKSIDCSSTTYNFTFTGTYEEISAATLKANQYYYLSGGALVYDENNTYPLKPMRWYMKMDSRGGQYVPADKKPNKVKILISGEEDDDCDETGIETPTESVSSEETQLFDLSGRKVQGTKKGGVYIQNGRKIIVR